MCVCGQFETHPCTLFDRCGDHGQELCEFSHAFLVSASGGLRCTRSRSCFIRFVSGEMIRSAFCEGTGVSLWGISRRDLQVSSGVERPFFSPSQPFPRFSGFLAKLPHGAQLFALLTACMGREETKRGPRHLERL